MGAGMNLEKGKYYRTRAGKKAYVSMDVDQDCPLNMKCVDAYPVLGFIESEIEPEGALVFSWKRNGCFLHDNDASQWDLVDEWKDPAREWWLGERNGAWYAYSNCSHSNAQVHVREVLE